MCKKNYLAIILKILMCVGNKMLSKNLERRKYRGYKYWLSIFQVLQFWVIMSFIFLQKEKATHTIIIAFSCPSTGNCIWVVWYTFTDSQKVIIITLTTNCLRFYCMRGGGNVHMQQQFYWHLLCQEKSMADRSYHINSVFSADSFYE